MRMERITQKNSTVLGYRRGFWRHLRWDGPVWSDGSTWYGGKGFEYLHVASWNPKDGTPPEMASTPMDWANRGGTFYRVRPWPELPGTRARMMNGAWHWGFPERKKARRK